MTTFTEKLVTVLSKHEDWKVEEISGEGVDCTYKHSRVFELTNVHTSHVLVVEMPCCGETPCFIPPIGMTVCTKEECKQIGVAIRNIVLNVVNAKQLEKEIREFKWLTDAVDCIYKETHNADSV